jgi:hypothetical protein
VNDGPAAGEIGDDFVLVLLLLGNSLKRGHTKKAAQKEELDSSRKSRAEA